MTTSTGEERFWRDYPSWKEKPHAIHDTREFLFVDWKSQKYRGMNHRYDRLTQAMLNSLRSIILGKKERIKSTTISALKKRSLVDMDGELTDYGRVLALRTLSLNQQCKFLNLPLEEYKTHWECKPEEAARSIFLEQGAKAYFVENTFGLFIDYIMGDATIAVAKMLGKKVYTLNLPYDPELFFWVKRELDQNLTRLETNHCIDIFDTCFPYLQTIFMEETPLQMVAMFDEIYRALGVEKVKALIYMFFTNPLAYNYRGWPDLFVIETDSAYCVEVKTTDRLHLNQLVTIPDLVQYTGIPVKVVRLKG